jgi:hypothetical protein
LEKKPPAKKKIPPDARAVAALALLMEGIDDNRFEEGLQAIIDSLKPRIRQAWSERRLKKEVYDPLTAAVQTGDVRTVIKAIYTNDTAMAMLIKMQADHKQAKGSAAA